MLILSIFQTFGVIKVVRSLPRGISLVIIIKLNSMHRHSICKLILKIVTTKIPNNRNGHPKTENAFHRDCDWSPNNRNGTHLRLGMTKHTCFAIIRVKAKQIARAHNAIWIDGRKSTTCFWNLDRPRHRQHKIGRHICLSPDQSISLLQYKRHG
jgi:hypothetical protein